MASVLLTTRLMLTTLVSIVLPRLWRTLLIPLSTLRRHLMTLLTRRRTVCRRTTADNVASVKGLSNSVAGVRVTRSYRPTLLGLLITVRSMFGAPAGTNLNPPMVLVDLVASPI